MADDNDVQRALRSASPRLVVLEDTAAELAKQVDLGVDVAEIARLGRLLDSQVVEWVEVSTFPQPDPVRHAFTTCNGIAFSLAGHARAAVGFGSMANRSAWKSRWDNVWGEWQRALLWLDRVLGESGLSLPVPATERSEFEVRARGG